MKTATVEIPCHRCNSTEVFYNDSGYNTFNPGHAECAQCGYRVLVMDCNCLDPWPDIKRAWDKTNTSLVEPFGLSQILNKIKKQHKAEAAKIELQDDNSGEIFIKNAEGKWATIGSFKDRADMNKFLWDTVQESV